MKWGYKVRRLREERSWTQQDLTDRSGLTVPHISKIESDDFQSPSTNVIHKLAKAFGWTPAKMSAHLYGGEADLPEKARVAAPVQIPVYTSFPFHAGSPTEPVEYVHRAMAVPSPKNIEGYIVHGSCLEPAVQNNDIIIIDREGEIENGDIVACLMNDELHLARIRKVAGELWLENNIGKCRFQECKVAAPVIEVIRRLK